MRRLPGSAYVDTDPCRTMSPSVLGDVTIPTVTSGHRLPDPQLPAVRRRAYGDLLVWIPRTPALVTMLSSVKTAQGPRWSSYAVEPTALIGRPGTAGPGSLRAIHRIVGLSSPLRGNASPPSR